MLERSFILLLDFLLFESKTFYASKGERSNTQPYHKKEKSDRGEREKGLREKRVQRGKPTGKRREGGCRILLRFSFSPLSLSREVFLFGLQEVIVSIIVHVTI